MPSVLQKFSDQFICRYDTYGSGCVVGLFRDAEDRQLLNYNFMALVDCIQNLTLEGDGVPSYEGTITAVPVTVAVSAAGSYFWDVDTTAGDIDFTSLAAIPDIDGGDTLVFYNLGPNSLLFDYKSHTHVIPPEDTLHLVYDAVADDYYKVS